MLAKHKKKGGLQLFFPFLQPVTTMSSPTCMYPSHTLIGLCFSLSNPMIYQLFFIAGRILLDFVLVLQVFEMTFVLTLSFYCPMLPTHLPIYQGCGGVCAQAGCHHWQQSILQRGLQAGEHQPSQQVCPAVRVSAV